MLPGPTWIHACPHCEAPFAVPSLLSGNTFGALTWTDGYRDAPMLPRPDPLGRCRACSALFLVAKAPRLGALDDGFPLLGGEDAEAQPAAWREARTLDRPSAADYREALAAGLAVDRDEEKELRIRAWWGDNDTRRPRSEGDAPGAPPAGGPARENLVALHDLLDPAVLEDRLFRIETARELGLFDEARALLDQEIPEAYGAVIEQQRRLVAARDTRLHLLGR